MEVSIMSINPQINRLLRVVRIGCILIAASGMAGCCPGPYCIVQPDNSSPHNKDYRFAIPTAQAGATVTIDGATALNGIPDPMWNNAAKFDLDLGANIPPGRMYAVADDSNLYLYFDIEADDFYQKDALVLLIGPNPIGGDYRRLHILPCGPDGVQGNCPTTAAVDHATKNQYWTGTFNNNAWTWSAEALPAGFDVKSAFQITTGGAKDRWSLEIKLPITGFSLPKTQFFGLYADLADVTALTGDAWQYPWPPQKPDGSSNIIGAAAGSIVSQIQTGTPSPDRWGLATLSDTIGNGVYITGSDIRTNHSQSPTQISLVGQNRFYATAHNNLSQAGQLADANGVRATFKIANWGVGTEWIDVPTGGPNVNGPINANPTSRETINATGSKQYEIGPWELTAQQQADYRAHDHQCIQVELDANDPNTLFFNNVAQQNMDFVETQSPYSRKASIGGGNYQKGAKQYEIVLRERTYNTAPELPWKSKIDLGKRRNSYVASISPTSERKNEQISFDVVVDPPLVDLPRATRKLSPESDKAVQFEVKAGEMITVLARGSILLRKEYGKDTEVGPAGADFMASSKIFEKIYRGSVNPEKRQLVDRNAFPLGFKYSPEKLVGALVGSWDGFRESSFIVSHAVSLKASESPRTLSLKFNDLSGTGRLRSGEGYDVEVISTPVKPYHNFGNPLVARNSSDMDIPLPVGANLPTWVMRGAVNNGKVIVIDGETFRALEPIGSFGSIVTKIGH
jgi:hypothetical protein